MGESEDKGGEEGEFGWNLGRNGNVEKYGFLFIKVHLKVGHVKNAC